MAVVMRGNYFDVRPGDHAFDMLSNFCKFFEVGHATGDDVWLCGEVVDGEFIFNGRLFLKGGGAGVVIDNFPKGDTLATWERRQHPEKEGFQLFDPAGELVFSYVVEGKICRVEADLYKKDGSLALHPGQGGMIAHVPIRIGRGGIVVT